jgi:hypothetical protein
MYENIAHYNKTQYKILNIKKVKLIIRRRRRTTSIMLWDKKINNIGIKVLI